MGARVVVVVTAGGSVVVEVICNSVIGTVVSDSTVVSVGTNDAIDSTTVEFTTTTPPVGIDSIDRSTNGAIVSAIARVDERWNDGIIDSSTVVLAAKAAPPVARTPTIERVVAIDVFMPLMLQEARLREVPRRSKNCTRNSDFALI